MARTKQVEVIAPTVPDLPMMHKWEKLSGKHTAKENGQVKVYGPGDFHVAPAGRYAGNNQWKDLGPVQSESFAEPKEMTIPTVYRKDQTKLGFFIYRDDATKPINEIPLTEEEADGLINANLESI